MIPAAITHVCSIPGNPEAQQAVIDEVNGAIFGDDATLTLATCRIVDDLGRPQAMVVLVVQVDGARVGIVLDGPQARARAGSMVACAAIAKLINGDGSDELLEECDSSWAGLPVERMVAVEEVG
jgi:hypothetical protein